MLLGAEARARQPRCSAADDRAIHGIYRPVLRPRARATRRRTLVAALALFVAGARAGAGDRVQRCSRGRDRRSSCDRDRDAGRRELGDTDRALRSVEAVLARHPEVERVLRATSVAATRGSTTTCFRRASNANVAEVFVVLEHYDQRARRAAARRVARRARAYPGARIELRRVRERPADRRADRDPRARAELDTLRRARRGRSERS